MCGINGLIYKNNAPQLKEILSMNASINHRGPDDNGVMAYKNILLGHVRLSIQDLSLKGRQPMSVDGRYWIIFNGEIYNFKILKKELINSGYKFYSNTDTEVILNAYKKWGVKSFDKFNGMWSFAILDKIENTVIISRDRYGVKPCYYSKKNNKIIFSSEIKGIKSTDNEYKFDNKKILLTDKFKERCFTTEYENIDIIQPGFYYKININNLEIDKKRWWNGLNNIPNIPLSKKKRIDDLKNRLQNSVKLRLISDTKIATSLSGGIDSSVIFSILNNIENCETINLNPFIVKYNSNKTINEAINLSKFYNREPIIVNYNENNEINNLSKLFSSMELTTAYTSQYRLYEQQNKRGFKVSIDGHGADECLAGYKSDLIYFSMFYQNNIVNLYEAISHLDNKDYLSEIIKKFGLVNSLKKFNNSLNNQLISSKNKNSYIDDSDINLIPKSLIKDIEELKNFDFPFQILYLNANYGHMQWLLNKWDKASMSHSVEIRSPFLDWNVFQYCLSLPSQAKINGGQNKSILREAYSENLTEDINAIKFKQGLPPLNFKIDNKSLKIIESIINEDQFKNNSIWDGKKILKDFNSKNINNISEIWKLVRLHLMDKGYNDIKNQSMQNKFSVKEKFNQLN